MKLFLSVLLFSICGFSQGLPSDQIQGPWKSKNPIYTKDSQMFMSFNFKKDKMDLTATCVYTDKTELQAQITVKLNYLANDIYIQEARQATHTVDQKICRVSLTQTKWQFNFNAMGEITLLAAVPYGMQFRLQRP